MCCCNLLGTDLCLELWVLCDLPFVELWAPQVPKARAGVSLPIQHHWPAADPRAAVDGEGQALSAAEVSSLPW